MRLAAWVKRKGKGAISQLAAASGVTYPTVHALAHDKQAAEYETAKKISAATDGAVSIPELCELPPPARKRKRARKAA